MKKTTKNIIIALAVLLVLGIAAAVLFSLPEPAAEEDSSANSAAEESRLIIDHDVTEVEQITLKNNLVDELWELVPITEGEDYVVTHTFTFKGWEDAEVNTSEVGSLARSLYLMYETKEIGEVQDLAEYGLKGEGEVQCTLDYTDGTSDTVIIGNRAGESSGRYVLYDGTVYISAVSSYIEQKKTDFVGTTLLTIETANKVSEDGSVEMEQNASIQSMHFSGTNYPQEIHLEESEHRVYTCQMTEPIHAGANTTNMGAIADQVCSVIADDVAAVNATEEELAQWGMDEPCAVLRFEINNETHELRLGSFSGGRYSLMVDDNPSIYLIDESDVDTWANRSLYELREPYIYLVNIKEAKTLTVEDKNGSSTYHVTRILNEERSTETQPFYDIEIEKDGRNVDYETAYQPFYAYILGVCIMNEDFAEPAGDALLSLTYEYYDNDDREVIEFYAHPENDRRSVVLLNGENVGIVRMADVEEIIEKNEIVSNFGTLKETE